MLWQDIYCCKSSKKGNVHAENPFKKFVLDDVPHPLTFSLILYNKVVRLFPKSIVKHLVFCFPTKQSIYLFLNFLSFLA